MNKDQVKGTVKEAAGKIQSKTGELVGNKEQQAKGLLKEAEGKTQKKVGNAKEVVKDAVDKM
ncbi:CsbD family protein [Polaromonas sp.]|uniref:CsbD family protein n=1 Tax=Polaromonas sp. TaxID=1869339 RepID=UPI0017E236C8|nr:CsbD family protein [Polaromonas sp.]NML86702.1 CsbD family protein [Polaromonas sp.]